MSGLEKYEQEFPVLNLPLLPIVSTDAEGEDEYFQGKKWTEISSKVLEYNTFILNCFTPEAFVYYLPSYMSYAYKNPKSAVAEETVERVLPQEDGENRKSFQEWWELLNIKQQKLVVQLVDLHIESGGIVNVGRVNTLKRAIAENG